MRLTVPYCEIGRRDDGDFRLICETEIEIPDVSGMDAPVVAQYDDLIAIRQMTRPIRLRQGRFFFPAIGPNGTVPLDAAAIQRNPAGSPPSDLLLYLELNGGYGEVMGGALKEDLALWYAGSPPKWFLDARGFGPFTPVNERRRQDLLAASRGLLLIDGQLHYEANEPFIAVTSTGQTLVRCDFDMRVHARRFGGDIARFSIADAERAEEFADREFQHRAPIDKQYDEVTVFDGHAFVFDAAADIAITVGLQLIELSQHRIHQMTAGQVQCWLDLRDETEAMRTRGRDPEKLIDLIREFLDLGMPNADKLEARTVGWLDWVTKETGRQLPSAGPLGGP
ncbi:hypothetical protein [Rhizobium sp. BK176]|uniref:hypothetical protein n=1 Tax=Rhizobium sp. BK176 TaxID=2587071 RepID=UPI002167D8BF|nr:hypothetical protein [Rhizobium sp. BK176]MCS4088513.1 hypothetical protein [Rhizobium sp. BK176]